MAETQQALGLDIGGTGIKAAVVDVGRGELVSERVRIKTPQPSVPEEVLKICARLQKKLKWQGPVGCGFPGLIKDNVVTDAPNLDQSWVGHDIVQGLRSHLQQERIAVLNDADAAGVAEMTFGAGKGRKGTVVLITLGTGIGTAVFYDGVLLPFTELGHLEMYGKDAELSASEGARIRDGLSWKKWAAHLDHYLSRLQYLLGVDLFILGGGGSKKAHKFLPHLKTVGSKVMTAEMGNLAGIVGAAMRGAESAVVRGATGGLL
ncbi:MAG: ROK family protein [Acidobacteriota bacterium]|nr:ROK family protein [Acidobacteriota bacterium]